MRFTRAAFLYRPEFKNISIRTVFTNRVQEQFKLCVFQFGQTGKFQIKPIRLCNFDLLDPALCVQTGRLSSEFYFRRSRVCFQFV